MRRSRTPGRPRARSTSARRCWSSAPDVSSTASARWSITREYRLAHEDLGFSLAELWQINLNGLRYGLAETGLRRRLMREFEAAGGALGL